jgi:hypothetical protein
MTITTLYVSRRVCLPPLVAATAFDVVYLAHADGGDSSSWTIAAGSAQLALNGTNLVPDHPALPLRQAAGRLRGGPGHRWFSVVLEVTPWSTLMSEVGVRAFGRSVPVEDGPRQRRYLDLAGAAVDHVAVLFEAVAAWDRDVVREAVGLARAVGPR